MEQIHHVFAQEAREQIAAMEDGLLRLEQGERGAETINGIFRAAHTIKGASGAVELRQIERFTHVLENVLDQLRNGEIEVDGDLITAILQGCDHIGRLIDRVESGILTPDAQLEEAGNALGDVLKRFVRDAPAAAALAKVAEPATRPTATAGTCRSASDARCSKTAWSRCRFCAISPA
jgi:two-component system chemotaxis sensor kinase CheA